MPCWVTYSNERRVVAISRDYSRLSPVFQRYLQIFTRSMCLARQTGYNAFRVIPVIKAISVAAFIWIPAEHTFVQFWANKVVITDQNWGQQNLCKSAENTQCDVHVYCTHMNMWDFKGQQRWEWCDDDNDDCSDKSSRSSDPFEFLIRPLMFSFYRVGEPMLHLLHCIGPMLHLVAGNDLGSATTHWLHIKATKLIIIVHDLIISATLPLQKDHHLHFHSATSWPDQVYI